MFLSHHGVGNGAVPEWHAGFMAMLPLIRRQVRSLCRCLSDDQRDEVLAETTAVAMTSYLGFQRAYPSAAIDRSALARSVVLHVLESGCVLCPERGEDVLSSAIQQQNGFTVERLNGNHSTMRLRPTVDERQHWHESAGFPVVERRSNGVAADGLLRWAQERRQQRIAARRLRSIAFDFDAARRIQRKLFPAAPPAVSGCDIAGTTRPAQSTGGDYFDYVPMLNGRIGIVVGDVSGHGFGPALLMASTRAYLRAFAETVTNLGDLLSMTNRVLSQDVDDGRFVTMIVAAFDARTRSLTYANAGHSPGYVLDPSGDVRRRMPGTGLPLGIRPNERFVESTDFPLDPGEIVVLLSDGVTEALDPNGNAFGLDRAIGVVHADRNISAAGIVDRLLVAVDAFVGDAPQADDITAVVMKLDRSDAVAADRAVVGAHDNGSASRRRGAGSIGADDK